MQHRRSWLALGLTLVACSRTPGPAPEPDHEPQPEPSASATLPAPSSSATDARQPPATYALTPRHAEQLREGIEVYQGENTVFIGMGARLGKLSEDGFEWLRYIPKDSGFGPNEITGAGGRYPDLYYVTYQSPIARAPTPTFLPLPKGAPSVFSPGGGAGFMLGVARLQDTLLVAGYSNTVGRILVSAGGKPLVRKQKLPQDAGCKGDELTPASSGAGRHAVETNALGATPHGTLVSLGVLCNKRNPTLEVWEVGQSESKFVDVPWRGDVNYTQAFPATDDALWFVDTKGKRILRYDSGKLSDVPAPKDIRSAIAENGVLYLLGRSAIYALTSSPSATPVPIVELPWPTRLQGLAHLGKTFWVAKEGHLYELTPSEPTRIDAGCKHPFVYLYSVTADAPKTYSFPKTRGVLRKFEAPEAIKLQEFEAAGRNVGIAVADRATAERLMEYLRKSMPKEEPELICYSPPDPREVDLTSGKTIPPGQ